MNYIPINLNVLRASTSGVGCWPGSGEGSICLLTHFKPQNIQAFNGGISGGWRLDAQPSGKAGSISFVLLGLAPHG